MRLARRIILTHNSLEKDLWFPQGEWKRDISSEALKSSFEAFEGKKNQAF
jgi:hypothetical protein